MTQAAPSLPLASIAGRYWLYTLPIWFLAAVFLSGLFSVWWFDQYTPPPEPFVLTPAMLISGLPLLLLSFLAHMVYIRWQLGRWQTASDFKLGRFTLIFYLINLILSVIYSIISRPLLLSMVFYYFITLIVFFLLPIYLLIGYLLGRYIQRAL